MFTHLKPGNSEANLPVMVFIHGGGFMSWGAELFGPKALVNEEIILVVIQYRLGIFGSKGLFQRAIIQSGSALCGWAISKNHKTFAVDVGNNLGCSLNEGTEKFLMCFQKADASKLLDLSLSTIEFGIAPFYGLPRVDGEFLPSHPATLLKKREYNKVDVIIGRTEHEGSFVLPSYVSDPSQLKKLQTNFERYGPMSLYLRENPDSSNMAEKIYKHYLKDGVNSLPDDIDDLEELLTDALFGYCQDLVVRFLADDPDTSLYLFRMDHLGEFSLLNGEPLASGKNWVTHTDELVYLFYGDSLFNFDLKKEEDLKFRKIITSLWRNFAKSGNPTPECSELKWDKIKGSNEIKQFSLTTNPKMEDYDFYEASIYLIHLNIQKRKLFTSLKTEQNILLGIYDDSYDQSSKTEL
ncbi:Carboxylesterase 1E [Armadillidium vulgare]|nr:Carboxylesterase 1E [Armadillidium vulgare]